MTDAPTGPDHGADEPPEGEAAPAGEPGTGGHTTPPAPWAPVPPPPPAPPTAPGATGPPSEPQAGPPATPELPPWPQYPPAGAPPGWVDPRAPWSQPRPPWYEGAPWGTPPAPVGDDGFPIYGPGSIPSIGRRAAARIVDTVLAMVVFVLASIPFIHGINEPGFDVTSLPIWYPALAQLLDVVYETVAVALTGRTLGKVLLGLRVEGPDGRKPGWQRAAVRILLPDLLGAIPDLGGYLIETVVYLTAIPNPLKQGIHDRLAGTIVISTR